MEKTRSLAERFDDFMTNGCTAFHDCGYDGNCPWSYDEELVRYVVSLGHCICGNLHYDICPHCKNYHACYS